MVRKEKLLDKILNCDGRNVQFSDFISALEAADFMRIRQSGTSHQIWKTPGGEFMNVQPAKDGKAKPYQIKQFQKLVKER